MRAVFLLLCLSMLWFVPIAQVRGQTPTPSPSPTPISPTDNATMATFLAGLKSLLAERRALIASGATQEQLQAWRQQNATRFAALLKLAKKLSILSTLQPRRLLQEETIPANASPTLTDFLSDRATLASARTQIHNQLAQSIPANATSAAVSQMQQQERQLMRQQYGATQRLQSARAQVLAQESAHELVPLSPTLRIPANASPTLAVYLTERDQLCRAHAQLRNQYAAADPATRQAALAQWREQNADLIAQVQAQAQALTQGN